MKQFIMLLAVSGMLSGQTQIDLRRQGKNVDFSTFVATRPAKAGTVLPAACEVGELYFKSNEPAGSNLYGCTSANTWTNLSGGGAGGGSQISYCTEQGTVDAYSCTLSPAISSYVTGQVVQFQASTTNTGPATVNFNGLGVREIRKHSDQELQARDIKAGQLVTLVFDGVRFQMQSQPANYLQAGGSGGITLNRNVFPWLIDVETSLICLKTANCAPTGVFDLSSAARTLPSRLSATEPATCQEGESYYNTATHRRRNCTAANTWSDEAAHQAGPQFSAGQGWYAPVSTGATYGAILGTNPLYVQVVIPYPMTVSAITGKTNTAAGTGQSIAAAVYDAGGTQIINAHGRVVEPGAGTLTISFAAPVSLMAGIYYLGIASEDNTVSILTSDLSATMLNAAGAKRVATGTGVTTGTGATYGMPGLMGTTSAVDAGIPALYLVR